MAGNLPFLDLNGVEVANAYRTASYLQNGLGPLTFEVGSLGCAILAREVGGLAPFVSPALDPAPWYNALVPESAEFLGFVPRMDWQTVDIKRSVSQRFGGIGGGVIGIEQFAARELHVEGMLIASSCAGMEYGRHWLYGLLGADGQGCALDVVRVRDSCPPSSGNDTRGERILYDAALISGIARNDDGGYNCCEYDGIEFTIAAQSPYLYSRAVAASPSSGSVPITGTSAPAMPNTSQFFPVQPATIDTFVRANTGPPPSGSWTGIINPGDGNTLRVLSNLLDNSTHTLGTRGSAYWNAATFGPDIVSTILVPTRVNNGAVELWTRIVNPGSGTTMKGVGFRVQYGASGGTDIVAAVVADQTIPISGSRNLITGQTFASGDTYGCVARGRVLEFWRKPSGGQWARVCQYYQMDSGDPDLISGYRVGVAIFENGATQTASTFSAATLTNGWVVPHDTLMFSLAAQPLGITSPIVTITINDGVYTQTLDLDVMRNLRIQVKPLAPLASACFEQDDFSVDDRATKWLYAPLSDFTITGGKLKPTVTTGTKTLRRSYDGTLANTPAWLGGRVEATFKLGTTITNGGWGVQFVNHPTGNGFSQFGAFLIKSNNTFAITFSSATGFVVMDSVSFTPVASTTYRIIYELNPIGDALWEGKAYLIDQSNPTQLLTRPLYTNQIGAATTFVGDIVTPAITVNPVDTAEEYDDFYAFDTADAAAFINVTGRPGVLVIDGSRRVSSFDPANPGEPVEPGDALLSSPIDTPLGWPDVYAGQKACLQMWLVEGGQSQQLGQVNISNLQWQNRVR